MKNINKSKDKQTRRQYWQYSYKEINIHSIKRPTTKNQNPNRKWIKPLNRLSKRPYEKNLNLNAKKDNVK